MKKYIFIVSILALTALVLEAVSLSQANKVAAESLEAGKLTEKITTLEEENSSLQSKIFEYTSFDSVASRAAELGYIETKSSISLYDELPIAINR